MSWKKQWPKVTPQSLSLIILRSSHNFLSFFFQLHKVASTELMLRNPLNCPNGKSSIEMLHLFCFWWRDSKFTAGGRISPTKQNKNIQPPETEQQNCTEKPLIKLQWNQCTFPHFRKFFFIFVGQLNHNLDALEGSSSNELGRTPHFT